MAGNGFMKSAEFEEIVKRCYPRGLRDREARWRTYREELRDYSLAAEVAARITEEKIIRPIISANPGRLVCYLDRQAGKAFTKSPMSIDDKIFRYLTGRKVAGKEPPTESFKKRLEENTDNPDIFLHTFFRDLPDVMTDLARFRIIANFLVDIHDLKGALRKTKLAPPNVVVDPNIEDRIEDDRWERGAGGHRAVHAQIKVRLRERWIPVEVLILSALELGWDAKAHMLYELTRWGRADAIDKKTRMKVRAMSDMLYVADALFDDIYREHFRGEDAR